MAEMSSHKNQGYQVNSRDPKKNGKRDLHIEREVDWCVVAVVRSGIRKRLQRSAEYVSTDELAEFGENFIFFVP